MIGGNGYDLRCCACRCVSAWLSSHVAYGSFTRLNGTKLAASYAYARFKPLWGQPQLMHAMATMTTRQAASTFFTELRAEIDKGSEGTFNQTQQENLKSLLTSRDEMITLLARNDPAAADRLTGTFVAYRKALGSGAEKH